VHVTFIAIDHEILSTVICTEPLLWLVQKLSVHCEIEKFKAATIGKQLDSLPRSDAMAELCSGKFSVAYCCPRATTTYSPGGIRWAICLY
jgi:hypothetical protein